MATRTDNLGLIKPDLDDNIDVRQLNANSDIIDDKIQTNTNNIELVKQELPKYLPLTGGTLTGDLQTANLNVQGNLTFSGDTNKQSYITKNNASIILNSDYTSQEDWILFKSRDMYASFRPNGNFNIGGTTYQTTDTRAILKSGNGISNVEVNDNKTVTIRAEEESSIIIGENNFAFNPDGRLWINGKQSFVDDFNTLEGDDVTFKWWKVNDYTIILQSTIINDKPSSGILRRTITFPIPFVNNSYVAMVSGVTQSRYTGSEKLRTNPEYTGITAQHTTTGLMVATDTYNDTELLIIGRIK